jgi:uncharacterized protein YndB with AHSA1/START domain/DNA-binding transcriptional ArsR family regulator
MAADPHIDQLFRALADPGRRQLLDSLNRNGGQTLRELCSGMDMARQSVSKHLAVLEAANLVVTLRRGREKLHYLNPAPIAEISRRWISRYHQPRVDALVDLKHTLEATPMPDTSFVYTTYIRSTPEQVWDALTRPAFTERYWGVTFDTDWKPGSTMSWIEQGVRISDPGQVVLESEPPRRLAYTWHTVTPEWADTHGLDSELQQKLAAETRTRVTFDIEPTDNLVKLTVIHDDFDPDSTMRSLCSEGWPRLLAGLKTLLETGSELEPQSAPAEPAPVA